MFPGKTVTNSRMDKKELLLAVHLNFVHLFPDGSSRTKFFIDRLNDFQKIYAHIPLAVFATVDGINTAETEAQITEIINRYSFPIFCFVPENNLGIVKSRRQTVGMISSYRQKYPGELPLTLVLDDDCRFVPDALTAIESMINHLEMYNVGYVGLSSRNANWSWRKPNPGVKPCVSYHDLTPIARLDSHSSELVIPAGIHGMALLGYSRLFDEIPFDPFLDNQGEWSLWCLNVYERTGLLPLYIIDPEIYIYEDDASGSPTRNRPGRFKQVLIYAFALAGRYNITSEDPVFRIFARRYLGIPEDRTIGVGNTYDDADLGWVWKFWERFTKFVPELIQSSQADPDFWMAKLNHIPSKDGLLEPQDELWKAIQYAVSNIDALINAYCALTKRFSLKPFGELEDIRLIIRLKENAEQLVEPFKTELIKFDRLRQKELISI